MEALLVAIVVGIICYVAFVYLFPKAVPEEGNNRTKHALKQIYADTQETLEAAEGESTSVIRRDFSDLAKWAQYIYRLPFMRDLYELILGAGFLKSAEMFLLYLLLGAAAGTFLFAQTSFAAISPIMGIIFSYFMIRSYVNRQLKKRNNAFLQLFPDVLDMIVRSVKSGFPLATALQLVSENMEEPVKSEFKMVTDEMALGRPLNEAISRLANRVREPDIQFFVVILAVQQETGGNLAEILGNLSNIIRKRKQLRNKVKAMTSEGRATAWVMGLLPVIVFGVLYLTSPEYLEPFWENAAGYILLAISAGLIASCIFVVYRMVDIDI